MQVPSYLKTVARTAGILVLVCAGGVLLLPLLLPFVLGYLFSLAVEPGVRMLERRTRLPRWLRSGICVSLLFLAAGTLLFCLAQVLWAELRNLVLRLPTLLQQLQPALDRLRGWLEDLAGRAPRGLTDALLGFIDRLFRDGDLLLQSGAGFLSSLVSRIVTGVPDLILTLITTLIATYMISSALPEVMQALRARLPAAWMKKLREGKERVRTALGGWLKAQLKLTLIVFLLLTAGLGLLRVPYALLFGGIIALLDALPVLGTGTVLIPWALLSFLQERSGLGFCLLGLYGLTALVRTALEPRLVGRHLGLHPLLTLMAFYTGYRLFGLAGTLLFPPLVLVCRQLPLGKRAEL